MSHILDVRWRHKWCDITPGVRWVSFFSWEWVQYLPEYVCQIWLRSDGRVEKKGGGGYRQTDKGKLQLYIIDLWCTMKYDYVKLATVPRKVIVYWPFHSDPGSSVLHCIETFSDPPGNVLPSTKWHMSLIKLTWHLNCHIVIMSRMKGWWVTKGWSVRDGIEVNYYLTLVRESFPHVAAVANLYMYIYLRMHAWYMHASMRTHIYAHTHVYMCIQPSTHAQWRIATENTLERLFNKGFHACMHEYIMRTCTYIHTCMQACRHAYVRTYERTSVRVCDSQSLLHFQFIFWNYFQKENHISGVVLLSCDIMEVNHAISTLALFSCSLLADVYGTHPISLT